MVTKKPKGLGRGLNNLLGPDLGQASVAEAPEAGLPTALSLADLVPGKYQPRTHMDEGAL